LLVISLKLFCCFLPIAVTLATMAVAISKHNIAYWMMVAPESSAKNCPVIVSLGVHSMAAQGHKLDCKTQLIRLMTRR
jgi:hypothetical protein